MLSNMLSRRNGFGTLFDTYLDVLNASNLSWSMDIGTQFYETDTGIVYTIDVPGFKEQDLTVEIKDRSISIKGERKTPNSFYKINKSLTISSKYNLDGINAELEDGLLTLTIPLKDTKDNAIKQIEVKKK